MSRSRADTPSSPPPPGAAPEARRTSRPGMFLSRLRYYREKLERAWADGTLRERVSRKLASSVSKRAGAAVHYLRLPPGDRRLSLSEGFADHRAEPSLDEAYEREVLGRLVEAYHAARADLPGAPAHYQLRGIWAEWIQMNYRPVLDALAARDHDRLGALLRNSAREPFAVGTGGSYDDIVPYRTSVFGGMYVRTLWCDYRDKLRDLGFDLSRMAYPPVGNPAGIRVNDSVVSIETLRHAYEGCAIAQLLSDVPGAVVLEIGGGFGGQAFQTIEQCRGSGAPVARYLDFDIPEVLLVAGYFLMMAFPGLEFRLYGEGPVSARDGERFDVGLFPHFAIDRVEPLSVDLLYNSNSFAEMDESVSRHYLEVVNRVCRRYFMHCNHETRLVFRGPDGTVSRNALGSELVPDASFKRIYKVPRVFGRPEDRDFKAFSYLYERRRD